MHTELSNLENCGVLSVIDNDECLRSEEKTLVVLGCPRGGTSAMAGALHEMGFYMGDGAAPPVYEGLALAKQIEAKDMEAAESTIRGLDAEYTVWGFKRPGFTAFLNEYHELFRNPIYLVVLRDPAATVSRGIISGRLKSNQLKKLRKILRVYSGIFDFIEHFDAPAIFISYEKLVAKPEMVLQEIMNCIAVSVSDADLIRSSDFVKPSPSNYLELSRAHRVTGAWTRRKSGQILGWANYVNKTMPGPVKVVLYDGEREVSSQIADRVLNEGIFPDSQNRRCGFEFDLGGSALTLTHRLRIRAFNDIHDLPLSSGSRFFGLSYLMSKFGLGSNMQKSKERDPE